MYKALYRKYRPKTFDDVIGQEHITKVLKNQLKSNTISHAYLFSGTRGTGKTSCAKILARAVNCESDGDKPCNKCPSCLESLDDSAIDIAEIDGASHSGVDDIRELKDRAFYQPTSLKYKVYIIDEIHMLSRGAFNALLKIIEEPPSHLIFIFATTEPEKIPLTILSRCQKFQFKRIDPKEILLSLKNISKGEGVSMDEETYNLIINNSDGSLRDAQSIMEQLVSSGKENIDYKYAANILGVVSKDILFKLVNAIIDQEPGELLEILDETISSGKDIEQLGKDILNHFRNLMIGKVSSNSLKRLVHVNEEQYLKQSEKLSLNKILTSMEKLIQQLSEIKYSQQKRALLEIVMLDIMNLSEGSKGNNAIKNPEVSWEKEILPKDLPKKLSEEKPLIDENKFNKNKEIDVDESENKEVSETPSNDSIDSGEAKYDLTLDKLKNDWNDILVEVRNSSRKLIHAYIIEASLLDYNNGKMTLGFSKEYEFHRNNLVKGDNLEFLENVISMLYNIDINIDAVFIEDKGSSSIENDIQTLTKLVGEENVKIL